MVIYFLFHFSVAFLPPDLGDGQTEDGEREPADEEDCHQGDQEGTGPAGIRKSGTGTTTGKGTGIGTETGDQEGTCHAEYQDMMSRSRI